jgi:hypothetical protein
MLDSRGTRPGRSGGKHDLAHAAMHIPGCDRDSGPAHERLGRG